MLLSPGQVWRGGGLRRLLGSRPGVVVEVVVVLCHVVVTVVVVAVPAARARDRSQSLVAPGAFSPANVESDSTFEALVFSFRRPSSAGCGAAHACVRASAPGYCKILQDTIMDLNPSMRENYILYTI